MIIACVYMQRNVQSVHARAFAFLSRARACAAVYIKHFDSVAVSPYTSFSAIVVWLSFLSPGCNNSPAA